MFSVVIPLYNKESSIANTLQSVLNQTYEDFEVIVVNDGSEDKSVEVVKKIIDPRIRIINQKNQGVSVARNTGIENSKNKWVTFLDGDDMWCKDHLFHYNKVIKKNPSLNWVLSGYISKAKNKKHAIVFRTNGILNNVFDALLDGLSIHTSAVCVRRVLFERYDHLYFRPKMNNSEDREVWYKLSCIDKSPYYIARPLSIYDLYIPNSLTKTKSGTSKEHFLTMQERIESFQEYQKLPNDDKEKFTTFNSRYVEKMLWGRYIHGEFKPNHKKHLNRWKYKLLKYTSWTPFLFRRTIYKIYRVTESLFNKR